MGILKTRQHHAAVEIDDPSIRILQCQRVFIVTDEGDPVSAYRDCIHPTTGGIDRIDVAVDKNDVGALAQSCGRD